MSVDSGIVEIAADIDSMKMRDRHTLIRKIALTIRHRFSPAARFLP